MLVSRVKYTYYTYLKKINVQLNIYCILFMLSWTASIEVCVNTKFNTDAFNK